MKTLPTPRLVLLVVCGALTSGAEASSTGTAQSAGTRAHDAPAAPSDVAPDVTPAIRVVPDVVANGQPFVVDLTPPPTIALESLVVDEARIGARSGVVLSRADGRVRFLFSIPIEEPATELPLRLVVRSPDGARLIVEKRLPIASHPYDERHLSVAKKFTRPSRAARRRAARESRELDLALAHSSKDVFVDGGFARPAAGEMTSPFGSLRTYNKRTSKSRHLGLDLDGATGDPIVATERGRVVLARDRYYSGNTVVIDHGGGLFSMYLHLSKFAVKEGALVERGQLLGDVGATGRVTGPHLHFSVKLDGEHLDPGALLALVPPNEPTSREEPSEPSVSP